MKLFLRKTGGQGLMLQGKLDVNEMPEPLASKTQEMLRSKKLAKAKRMKDQQMMPDCQEYELTLLNNNHVSKHFKISDSSNEPDVLDWLDELMSQIMVNKLDRANQS